MIGNLKLKIKNSGFTLLETLASISVLTLAVIGPLALASYAIRSASISQNQLMTFYLAQEAMEYIKNKRDNIALAGLPDWLEGLGNCRGSRGCVIDIPNNNIINCGGGGCPKIKYDSATGFYNYSSGAETSFIREIKLSDVVAGREAKITVTVSWQEIFGPKSFTLEENIFNWP